jgi:hypothetical protein
MAVMPGADRRYDVTGSLMARYDIVCVHTIVGYAPAHAAHFSTRADGYIYQSRDTKYRSAANLNGNHRVIAIENEDHGGAYGVWNTRDGHQVPGFTKEQIEAIAQICAWAYKQHGIPLVLAPDSKPGSRGIAYHRQGIDGNFQDYGFGGRVAGGELWSSAGGKVCPGDRRINQLINEIIPRARVIAGLDKPTQVEEEDDNMVKFMQGNSMPHVFKVEYSHAGPEIAVRTWVPNDQEPGYRAFLAMGGKVVRDIPQAVLDAIPYKPGSMKVDRTIAE